MSVYAINAGDYCSKLSIYYYKSKYTEEEFAEKMKEYKEKKKAYNKWLKEEFPKIEAERIQKEINKLKEKKEALELDLLLNNLY